MARLSSKEINFYHEQGYVVPAFQLSEARIAALRANLDRVIEDNPGTRPEQLVSAHIERGNEGVKGSRVFLELAKDPDILDLVEQLIGPDIILWGCQIFCKPPADGMEVPMHQDGQYWPIRPLATCTVWLALDDSMPENGCLRVVPGSHKDKNVYEHYRDKRDKLVLNQAVAAGQIDDNSAVDIALRAGQMSMHDVYMVHGSNANTSNKRRAGVAIRYMPASSHFRRDLYPARSAASGYTVDFSERPLWLLRGRDACGKNDFSIGHAPATPETA